MNWSDLCWVESGGRYSAHCSVGQNFVMQDLPWQAK